MNKVKDLFARAAMYFLDIDRNTLTEKIEWKKAVRPTVFVGLLFVLPAVISNLVFDWYPMLDGILKSFYTWSDRNPEPVFVGLNNFVRVLSDPAFINSLGNMVFFLIANLILMFPSIIFSIVLFRVNSRTQYIYRILLCLQLVIPALIFTLMWIFILGYDFGAVNNLLESMGFERVMFLSDPKTIKWTILLTGIPFISANTVLVYLGGLNGISESVWEAAKLDGVGPVRRFYTLELPLIAGQFKLNLISVIGASITAYGTQLVYYNSSNHSGIMTPGLLMYHKAFPPTGAPDYGYSYALGLILFIVSLTISLLAMKLVKSE